MRSHFAIYVDVGYLLAAAATRVTGTSLRRGVQVDHPELISSLIARAEEDCGLPLLRVNWYDSGARPGGMPDFTQDEIGLLPRVKLRLGRLSHAGEQKGVDLRIGLDLATHGRNRVVDVIYLVSGDDDLTEAVEEAQGHGVQVILLAVPGQDGKPHGVARHLQRAADGLVLLDGATIDNAVRSRAIPEPLVPEEFKPDDEPVEGEEGAAAEAPDAAVTVDGEQEPSPAGEAAAVNGAPTAPAASAAPSDGGQQDSDSGEAAAEPATEPEPAEDDEREPVGAGAPGPSPSLFAKRKATVVVPPPDPVWTSASGVTPGGSVDAGVDPELIDAVARQVVRSWCATATPEDVGALKQQRPSIPPDLDRALLTDLSTKSEQYDIDEVTRHELRNRFWRVLDQVKLI